MSVGILQVMCCFLYRVGPFRYSFVLPIVSFLRLYSFLFTDSNRSRNDPAYLFNVESIQDNTVYPSFLFHTAGHRVCGVTSHLQQLSCLLHTCVISFGRQVVSLIIP